MTHVRKDVYKLPAGDKTLEWYGKAVLALRQRSLTQGNSWTYLAAMHGADEDRWRAAGYVAATTRFPSPLPSAPAWNQCQHQSWFFLPWHRGYLAAFEAIVRDAIAHMPGGPADWSLPYWNYNDTTNPDRLKMPTAFAQPTLPNGEPNGLFVERRFGERPGPIVLEDDRIEIRPALLSRRFTGIDSGTSSGFGGPTTPYWHGGGTGGVLEREPHNAVHGMVGGAVRDDAGAIIFGLMSRPDTAALDPIFWLHHANIDRLWSVWLKRSSQNANPPDSDWMKGPKDIRFTMPRIDGSSFQFSPADVTDTTAPNLDYDYQDTSDPFPGRNRLLDRLVAFKLTPDPATASQSVPPMPQKSELVGNYAQPLRLGSTPVTATVPLDKATQSKLLKNTITAFDLAAPKAPDRVFVNVENIRGSNDAASFFVYVNLPEGADPKSFPDHRAQSFTLFGVDRASQPDGPHGGNGLTEVIEITEVVDRLQAKGQLDPDTMKVTLVPANDVQAQDNISVGAISIYRQGD